MYDSDVASLRAPSTTRAACASAARGALRGAAAPAHHRHAARAASSSLMATPASPPPPPPPVAEAAPKRWRLRDAAGTLGSLIGHYGAEGVGLLVPTLGGAVDIVVVRQPDGTLKSSPFYGARHPQRSGSGRRFYARELGLGPRCALWGVCAEAAGPAVRFGKYQGVLRSRLKRVEVWVNGVKARHNKQTSPALRAPLPPRAHAPARSCPPHPARHARLIAPCGAGCVYSARVPRLRR
jgi:hypothetical protein